MTKLIHDRHLLRLIPLLLKYLHISRQGCRVAAHVDDTFRRHMDQSVQKHLIAALSRWVYDHDVRVGAVAALLVYVGNDFLCLADKELGICDPLISALCLASSIACGTISTPYTFFAFCARNKDMVPIPQYMSHTVSSPAWSAYSKALLYRTFVWTGFT